MNVPANLFTSAFREQRLGLMFTVLVAALVYLASLAVAAQGGLAVVSSGWSRNVQGRLTVEVPFPDDGNAQAHNDHVKKITAALKAMPDVTSVAPLSDSEIASLLKPWFMEGPVLASLPLPALIDIDLKNVTPATTQELRKKLMPIDGDVRISSRAEGLDQLMRLIDGLRIVAGVMIALTGLTLVIAISLICRAAMAVQHDTIELLHFMGATDSDIAGQFVNHARRLSLPAAFLGFLGAAATSVLLFYLMQGFWGLTLAAGHSWFAPGIVMAFVPLAAIIVALVTTRVSVLTFLRRMP